MKKIGALVLALVMVLAMNVNAFAATVLPAGGKVTTGDTELTIKKEIAFFAPDTTEINYPAISYTYTIAPATDAAGTITDSAGNTATVKVGVTDGVVMGTDNKAVFVAGSVAASTTGALKEDSFAVSVVLAKFSSAGIYRYQLTEACDNDMAKLGYVEATGTNNEKRYLDVYIGNGASGLEVKGYVLFYNASGNKTIDSSDDESFKTEGFVHEGGDSNYTNDLYVDKYSAYNVTITKEVTGTMGDKNNPFPFSVEITGAPVNSTILINVDGANATSPILSLAALDNGEVAMAQIAALKDGQSVTIKGIPVGAKVSIKEKNNTADAYKLTTTGLGTAANGTVTAGADSGVDDVESDVVATKDVKFTNTLEEVSQTGVVLRFAPYALMLGAGVALFIILKVRKNKAVEEA